MDSSSTYNPVFQLFPWIKFPQDVSLFRYDTEPEFACRTAGPLLVIALTSIGSAFISESNFAWVLRSKGSLCVPVPAAPRVSRRRSQEPGGFLCQLTFEEARCNLL